MFVTIVLSSSLLYDVLMFLIDMYYHNQTVWRNIDDMNVSYTLNLAMYVILQF